MDTYIAYFDETGDDGSNIKSSNQFVLTSAYMNANSWQSNYDIVREGRRQLKDNFGFHISERIVDRTFVKRVFVTLKTGDVLNLKASNNHDYCFVIYPR